MSSEKGKSRGQSLVEFALTLPALLMIVLGIIETALVIQGHLAVQHAAREAARFASTYQPPQGACLDADADNVYEDGINDDADGGDPDDLAPWPACPVDYDAAITETELAYLNRRIELIRGRAVQAATGLRINDDHVIDPEDESLDPWEQFQAHEDEQGFFGVLVWGFPSFQVDCNDPDLRNKQWVQGDTPPGCLEHPGLEGLPVRVLVQHNVEVLDPLYRAIIRRVPVRAEAQMINEGVQVGFGDVPPPYFETEPDLDEPDVEPVDTPTPVATNTPMPASTITLDFDVVTNTLPDDRRHPFVATVRDASSQLVVGAPVRFAIIGDDDVGGFDPSASDQEDEGFTDGSGQLAGSLYSDDEGTTTIRAWVDEEENGVWDGELDEPSDTAVKIWDAPEPYIVPSDYDVFAGDDITVHVIDHQPGEYRLLLCAETGSSAAETQTIEVDEDDGWRTTISPFTIPMETEGRHRLETHPNAGEGCGGDDLVGRSDWIEVRIARPDLSVLIQQPSNVCPQTEFILTATIRNRTRGVTTQTFDVDFYVDPDEGGGILPKQWIDGIGAREAKTITVVAWVGAFGEHEIQAVVDPHDSVEEEPLHGNAATVTFTTADGCEEGLDPAPWGLNPCKPPGSRVCEALFEKGGFEGNTSGVYAHWHAGGVNAYQRQSRYFYEGTMSMRLHASLGSYPECPSLDPYVYQNIEIPDLTGGCTETMNTSLVVRGQRLIADSLAPCSVPGTMDPDDRLYVKVSDGDNVLQEEEIASGATEGVVRSPAGFGALPLETIPVVPAVRADAGNRGVQGVVQPNHVGGAVVRNGLSGSSLGARESGSSKALLAPVSLESQPTVSAQSQQIAHLSFEDGGLAGWVPHVGGGEFVLRHTGTAHHGEWHLRVEGDGSSPRDYPNLETSIDTSGFRDIQVTYYRADYRVNEYDQFVAKWYDGAEWIELESGGAVGDFGWTERSFDLSGFGAGNGNSNTKLRFVFECESGEYYYLDDVRVSGSRVPTVDFGTATYTVTEEVGTATITATLSDADDWPVVVHYSSTNGTAIGSEDYSPVNDFFTFGVGETEATFTVPITDDVIIEDTEFFNLTLENAGVDWVEAFELENGTQDDNGPTGWSVDTSECGYYAYFAVYGGAFYARNTDGEGVWTSELIDIEGAAPIDISVDVASDDAESGDTLQVFYELDGDRVLMADLEGDFAARTVSASGLSGAEVRVVVEANLNGWYEWYRWDNVTVSNGGGPAEVGDNSPAKLFILDNDEVPQFRFSQSDYRVREGNGPAVITATLTAPSPVTTSVSYSMSNGTANPGEDYTSTAGSLVFAPGVVVRSFELGIIDDSSREGDETVNLFLHSPEEAALDADGMTATLTIEDDDTPYVSFVPSDYDVAETAGQAVITVALSMPVTETVTVNYATLADTATPGEDYTPVTGTLAFDAGVEALTFTVPIIDDETVEGAEALRLELSEPVGVDIGVGSARLTILDDDGLEPYTWAPFQVDFGDVGVGDRTGDTLQVRFYATHNDNITGTWFYLDALDARVCNEWPEPTQYVDRAKIEGTLRMEGERIGGVDVWAYGRNTKTTYHTVSLMGGDDLYPAGTYHFYNVEPDVYTVYAEAWREGELLWDSETLAPALVAGEVRSGRDLDLGP